MPIIPGGRSVYNYGNAPAISTGLEANIPDIAANGQLYFSSDTFKGFIYEGGVWHQISGGGGGGSQTWEQTLEVIGGENLVNSHTTNHNGNDFIFDLINELGINMLGLFSVNDYNTGGNIFRADPSGDVQINNTNNGTGFNTMHWNPDGSTLQYVNNGQQQFLIEQILSDGSITQWVTDGVSTFQSSFADATGAYQRLSNTGAGSTLQTMYIGGDGYFQITGNNNVSTQYQNLISHPNGDFEIYGNDQGVLINQLCKLSNSQGNVFYSSDNGGNLRGYFFQSTDGAEISMFVSDSAGLSFIESFRTVAQDITTGLTTVAHLNSQTTISDENTTATDFSSVLEARSTTRGFLPPRMSTVQKLAIVSPSSGLMVYDVDLSQICYFNGVTWIAV